MSKAPRLMAGAASTAVAGLLVLWLAPASSAQTPIQVLDREGPYEKMIDVGKPGFSAGDVILETHPLVDAADGTTVVGRDFARLQVLRVLANGQDFVFIIDSTLRFEDGDVVFYGTSRFSELLGPEGVTLPVTAGTGAYEGATGTVNFVATATEGEFLVTIELATT
jgi:hypothetical protein